MSAMRTGAWAQRLHLDGIGSHVDLDTAKIRTRADSKDERVSSGQAVPLPLEEFSFCVDHNSLEVGPNPTSFGPYRQVLLLCPPLPLQILCTVVESDCGTTLRIAPRLLLALLHLLARPKALYAAVGPPNLTACRVGLNLFFVNQLFRQPPFENAFDPVGSIRILIQVAQYLQRSLPSGVLLPTMPDCLRFISKAWGTSCTSA